MSDDQFTKLFKYMQQNFTEIRREISALRSDITHIYGVTDTILGRLETQEQERLASNLQLDRHEVWIQKASQKLKVTYDPSA